MSLRKAFAYVRLHASPILCDLLQLCINPPPWHELTWMAADGHSQAAPADLLRADYDQAYPEPQTLVYRSGRTGRFATGPLAALPLALPLLLVLFLVSSWRRR